MCSTRRSRRASPGCRRKPHTTRCWRELLDVRVAKSASFTRWDARPLSPEQLAYAREDVVHLLELAAELERRLTALGRLEWAREECEPLQDSSDERDLESVFARLPRVRNLNPTSQMVARELRALARGHRIDPGSPGAERAQDAALMEIAKRRPTSTERLGQIRGINQGSLRRQGSELLDAIRRGSERPPTRCRRTHDHRRRIPTTRR